jgi:hypothetical protein
MIKKIITGILITAVLSLAATGTLYAYQKEWPEPGRSSYPVQSELPDAATGKVIASGRNPGNYNGLDIPCAGNRHRQNNIYCVNEKNDCPEPSENNYSWKHNYNHKNENCLDYSYKYEHNYRYENSCDYCGNHTCRARNFGGSGK